MPIKLQVVNFRKYAQATFLLDGQHVLITGASGSGKTTLFMAILFAMLGQGRKVVRYGAKSCQVILMIDSITIQRSRRPNRLMVKDQDGQMWEDDEAQAFLNDTFKGFKYGYFAQRMDHHHFMVMSPCERLKYLQGLACGSLSYEHLLEKAKRHVSMRQQAHDRIQHELDLLIHQYPFDDSTILQEIVGSLSEAEARADQTRQAYLMAASTVTLRQTLEHELNQLNLPSSSVDTLARNMAQLKETLAIQSQLAALPVPELTSLDTVTKAIHLVEKTKSLGRLKTQLEQARQNHVLLCPHCNGYLTVAQGRLQKTQAKPSQVVITTRLCEAAATPPINLFELEHQVEQLQRDHQHLISLVQPNQIPQLITWKGILEKRNRLQVQLATIPIIPGGNQQLLHQWENEWVIWQQHEAKQHQLKALPRLDSTKLDELKIQYEQAQKQVDALKIHQWRERTTTLKNDLKNQSNLVDRAQRLLNFIKQAHIKSVQSLLDDLNTRAQIYMDYFFPETRLEAWFTCEDVRLELIIRMDQQEIDSTSLSGGEYARLMLAYTIAMAELNQCRLLLLDECLASLDQETTHLVVDACRQLFPGQILFIAHQVTEGSFDQLVQV